ncbi:unnamed protein product [Linum trigynum]|uniref:Uncharacterized protein n=1 Tax=Linum trigynum TaxID=586398 RepID=A0AAV2EFF1_9ROSI
MERLHWMKGPKPVRKSCLGHFVTTGDPLPIRPKDYPVRYRLKSCERISMKGGPENIAKLKELLKNQGPFIGSFYLRKDYTKKTGVYFAVGADGAINREEMPPRHHKNLITLHPPSRKHHKPLPPCK